VISRIEHRALGTAAGLALDRWLGEPPAAVHPVAAFGRLMGRIERRVYADDRPAGASYTGAGVMVGWTATCALPTALAVYVTAAGRELRHTAAHIRDALYDEDLELARRRVPALVGRDPTHLDASGLAAAVIESLAENTVDAVVAPAWWALMGGAGAAGAYRAVNTMDAMVGNRSARYQQFGWASARLDDLANLGPARLTALLVAGVRPRSRGAILRAVQQQAPAHPSPNAGVAEAAFAVALGRELGGPLEYEGRHEDRPRLGGGPRPDARDIDRAIALASHVELALIGLLLSIAMVTRALGWARRR
jgi:adenosylcobinamide-phosphate synthase